MKFIDYKLSINGTLIKCTSLFLIIIGHFWVDFPWLLSWIAIFNFSFLSGTLTCIKYQDKLDLLIFWKRKIQRFGINLMVINTFLLIIFLCQDKQGIFTWQTIIAFFGLNGVINWFFLPNPSPYRVEIWFFTLLIIFYLVFPLLLMIYKKRNCSILFVIFTILITAYLNEKIKYNYALWLAICSFSTSGAFINLFFKINAKTSLLYFFIVISMMIALNLLNIKYFNYIGIFISSICFLSFFIKLEFPIVLYQISKKFENCLLEIYLIHRYLFIKITNYKIADFCLSIILILIVAINLRNISNYLRNKIFNKSYDMNRLNT